MPYRICWQQDSVKQVLQTEALAGNDAVFMATHFPIEGFEVGGNRAAEIAGSNERSLFVALSKEDVRHAFCVVRGEPGSGKSHLIRWLNIQWQRAETSDLVLLIQRADGSLQSTLEQLRKVLPLEGDASIWQGIEASDGIRFEARVKLFHNALGLSLAVGFFEKEMDDMQWCEERALSELLLSPEVRDRWNAPSRILATVCGQGGERNSELAQFLPEDVRELVHIGQAIEHPKRAHLRFLQRLRVEFEAVDDLANRGKPFSEIAPEASQVLRALNERLNPAIQRFLGISPNGMRELFRRLRRRLRDENRRLVLLLEDITSFQGVDNLLIDVLVTDSQTRPDECDLISVVGLTPSYFEKFIGGLGNIVARVTHMIRLGRGDHGFETVTSLETNESQVRFTAKYLNAVRLGITGLKDGSNVPNACDGCPDQEPCHRSFGSRDGYGLYPISEIYITSNYPRLVDPEGKLTQMTPRGLLQNLVHPALFHVDDLANGDYPPPEFPIAPIRRATELPGPVRDRLSAIAEEDESILARLRLLTGLWGRRPASVGISQSEDGEPEFAGIRKSIFETFQLPWPGGASTQEPSKPDSPIPETEEEERRTETPGQEPRPSRTPPKPASKTQAARTIRTGDLERRLKQLEAWEDGRRLEDEPFWNQQVWLAISDLPWQQLGIPWYLWHQLFTERLILLSGTGQARAGHLVIPRETWVFRGLYGYLCLRTPPDGAEIELLLQYAARFRRKLQQLVINHAAVRMSPYRTQSGETWSPMHTAVQLLTARAWLRGDVKPLADEPEQWRTILSDEPEATSAPGQRVDTWDDFVSVKGTGSSHSRIREVLREWITLPQGSEPRTDLVDAAEGLRALRELKIDVAYTKLPAQVLSSAGNSQISELVTLSEKASETASKLNGVADRESGRLRRQGQQLLEQLRGNSVREHVERIETAISSVLQYLQDAGAGAVPEWKVQVSRLRNAGYLADGSSEVRAFETFLMRVEDETPPAPIAMLQWCLEAPVQSIGILIPALDSGEAVIGKVAEYVSAYLNLNSGSESLNIADIYNTGKRLSDTAKAIELAMRSNHD
jgi:hypothetical protein